MHESIDLPQRLSAAIAAATPPAVDPQAACAASQPSTADDATPPSGVAAPAPRAWAVPMHRLALAVGALAIALPAAYDAQAQEIRIVAPTLPPRQPGPAGGAPAAAGPSTASSGAAAGQGGAASPYGSAGSAGSQGAPAPQGTSAYGSPGAASGASPYGSAGSPGSAGTAGSSGYGPPAYGTPGYGSPGYGSPGYGTPSQAAAGGGRAPASALASRAPGYGGSAPAPDNTAALASAAVARSSAAGLCRAEPTPDRQSVTLLGADALPRQHVPLGEFRVQQVIHSPDGRWAVALTKLRGQPQFAAITLDLSRCEAQNTVDLPAAGDDARFEADDAIVLSGGKERRVKLANARVR